MGYGVSISAPLVAAKSIHSTSPSRPKEHKSSRGLVHFGGAEGEPLCHGGCVGHISNSARHDKSGEDAGRVADVQTDGPTSLHLIV